MLPLFFQYNFYFIYMWFLDGVNGKAQMFVILLASVCNVEAQTRKSKQGCNPCSVVQAAQTVPKVSPALVVVGPSSSRFCAGTVTTWFSWLTWIHVGWRWRSDRFLSALALRCGRSLGRRRFGGNQRNGWAGTEKNGEKFVTTYVFTDWLKPGNQISIFLGTQNCSGQIICKCVRVNWSRFDHKTKLGNSKRHLKLN